MITLLISLISLRKMIVFNAPNDDNNTNWESCLFEQPSKVYGEEIPDLNDIDATEWNEFKMQPHYQKGFETRGFVFRSKKYFQIRS